MRQSIMLSAHHTEQNKGLGHLLGTFVWKVSQILWCLSRNSEPATFCSLSELHTAYAKLHACFVDAINWLLIPTAELRQLYRGYQQIVVVVGLVIAATLLRGWYHILPKTHTVPPGHGTCRGQGRCMWYLDLVVSMSRGWYLHDRLISDVSPSEEQ